MASGTGLYGPLSPDPPKHRRTRPAEGRKAIWPTDGAVGTPGWLDGCVRAGAGEPGWTDREPLTVAGTCRGEVLERRRTCEPGSQARGSARNLVRAWPKPTAHGQRAGRWSVTRRADRVSRPGRPNSRRRSVLVVTMPSPMPMRAVQLARSWAITCTASQAPLAANFPDGRWLRPTPYFRSRMAFSISAYPRWSDSSSSRFPSLSVMQAW